MYPVGGNQGRAFQFNQGTGESTAFKTPLIDDMMSFMAKGEFTDKKLQEKEAREAARKAEEDYQKRIDALNKNTAESDYLAQDWLQKEASDLVAKMGEYRAKGNSNPLLEADQSEEAKAFRRKFNQLTGYTQGAKHVVEQFKTMTTQINANPDKYDLDRSGIGEGLTAERLQGILSGSEQMPQLKFKKPKKELVTTISAGIKANGISTENFNKVGEAYVLGLGQDEGVMNTVNDIFDRLPVETLTQLEAEAEKRGWTPQEQYLYQQTEAITQKDYTWDGYEAALAGEVAKQAKQHKNEDGSFGPKTKGPMEVAKSLLRSNPVAYSDMIEKYGSEKKWASDFLNRYRSIFGPSGAASAEEESSGGGGGDDKVVAMYNDIRRGILMGEPGSEGALQGQEIQANSGIMSTQRQPLQKGKIVHVQAVGDYRRQADDGSLVNNENVKYIVRVAHEETVMNQKKASTRDYIVDDKQLKRLLLAPAAKYLNQKAANREIPVTIGPLD